jgi:hypothetical protein
MPAWQEKFDHGHYIRITKAPFTLNKDIDAWQKRLYDGKLPNVTFKQ